MDGRSAVRVNRNGHQPGAPDSRDSKVFDDRARQGERTATRPAVTATATAPATDPQASSSSLDLLTLGLAALGSALAALVTSQFWEQGTVISAAVTPVIISLVKEGLRRPAERVSAAGARVATVSKSSLAVASPRGAGRPTLSARPARGGGDRVPRAPWPARDRNRGSNGTPLATGPEPSRNGDSQPDAMPGPRIYRRRGRPRLRVALITGALAFVIAAFALTVPELVLGGAPGRDGGTTFFGGGEPSADETDGSSKDDVGSQGEESPPSEAPEPESEAAPAPEEEAEPAPAPQQEEAPAEPQAPAAPAPTGD